MFGIDDMVVVDETGACDILVEDVVVKKTFDNVTDLTFLLRLMKIASSYSLK